jgi:endogenous inhibitor of DNA gyrase (YacG/DUF329 family)
VCGSQTRKCARRFARTRAAHFGFAWHDGPAYLDGMSEPSYVAKSCPICGKPAADRFRPFCSGRCKDVDLNRWFTGAYAIPAEESADDSDGQDVSEARGGVRDREGR